MKLKPTASDPAFLAFLENSRIQAEALFDKNRDKRKREGQIVRDKSPAWRSGVKARSYPKFKRKIF